MEHHILQDTLRPMDSLSIGMRQITCKALSEVTGSVHGAELTMLV